MNSRLTNKDRGLIKGALRRVFARSDLHKEAVAATRIEYSDPARPRVKKWSRCPICIKPTPTYLVQIDHIIPVIAVTSSLAEMTWDELVDRMWCPASNLQGICLQCHKIKCKVEAEARKTHKKERKK